MASPYPERAAARDRWISGLRPPRARVDPWQPSAAFVEDERTASGTVESVATVFLTNRECPWRCLMCDLWKHTLAATAPAGAIVKQIDIALQRLPAAQSLKLYNSGSFFDPRAIRRTEYAAIAGRIDTFKRVIVESHPKLIGESVLRFRDLLAGRLEVALGLETAHPRVLAKLNKRMTLAQFQQAAGYLRRHDIDLRVFILVKPPFLEEQKALFWAQRSIDFAFDSGASVVSLIPTRLGNGALEELAAQGQFAPPKLATLETAVAYGLGLQRGRTFADTWDWEKWPECPQCLPARVARLQEMNRQQRVPPLIKCAACRS